MFCTYFTIGNRRLSKTNKELRIEIDKIVTIVNWIDKRNKEINEYYSCKLPHFIVTRWNTLVNAIESFLKEKENIQRFITETTQNELSQYHPNHTK